MKKILILIGLFISVNVYAQPKQIYVGGDVLTVSGDTLYKNGVFLAELGGTAIDTTGQFVTAVEALNDTVARSKKGGVWTNFNVKGRNFHGGSGITRTGQTFNLGGSLTTNAFINLGTYAFQTLRQGSGYESKIEHSGIYNFLSSSNNYKTNWIYNDTAYIRLMTTQLVTPDSVRAGIFIGSDGYGFSVRSGTGQAKRYSFPLDAPSSGQILKANGSGDLVWANESGGGGGSDNFPTVDDTLTGNRFLFSDTYNLLFSHASGNAFTLSNTGLSYDVAGSNAVVINSSYNEFKTATSGSVYGMLKTTSGSAGLFSQNASNSSSVYAYPRYVELNGQDSTVMKNIPIDTLTYHLGLKGNKVVKTTNPLPYREYVASLTQTGTGAPVATVIFSNLPDSVVWDYVTAGVYRARYYNGGTPIDLPADYASITNNVINDGEPKFVNVQTGSSVVVYTYDTSAPIDDFLGSYLGGNVKHIITIRVYE